MSDHSGGSGLGKPGPFPLSSVLLLTVRGMSHDLMLQEAPYPHELDKLVRALEYRPGWYFELRHLDRGQGSTGLTFSVYTVGYDTYHPERGQHYRVVHYFPVPPASYNRESWLRWLLERLLEVERHECCEFFQLRRLERDGESVERDRPFAPNHGPGWDPYIVLHMNTPEAAATRFTGERTDLEVPEGWQPVEVGVEIGAEGDGWVPLDVAPDKVCSAQVLGARGTAGLQKPGPLTGTMPGSWTRLVVSDAQPGTIARVRYYVAPKSDLPPIPASTHAGDEVDRLGEVMGDDDRS